MGEFVDDIRAALVMNPNFCRLRFKKEEASSRKNGFVRKEESIGPKNTVVCGNLGIEDSNGNVCLQMKELNAHRKVTFKEDQKRLPLRRRASDIEIRGAVKLSTRKQNCAKCSPTLNNPKKDGTTQGNQLKISNEEDPFKLGRLVELEKLNCPSFDDNSMEDMDLDADSKYASSDTQSKDSSCDVDLPRHNLPDSSAVFFKERPVDLETSDSSFVRHANDIMSLDDVLSRYSTVLDENSLQILQKSMEPPDHRGNGKKPFTLVFFTAFVLMPTVLFYFLVFLYFFQPEPFYSLLLKNLKLKDEPQLSPLSTLMELVKRISWQLYDFAHEKLEELVTNFN